MGSKFYLSDNSTQTDLEFHGINEEENKKSRKCFNPKCLLNWTLHIVIIFMFDILFYAVNYFILEKYSDCLSCLKIFNKVLIGIIAALFNTMFSIIITKGLNKIFNCFN
jgi:uncharacterized membrane protein YagU involved in acid resistance